MKKLWVLIAAVFGLALPIYAQAAAGDLDPSFGSGGKVLTDFSGLSEDVARSVAVAPGGKVVVAGFSDMGGGRDFALARYRHDGSLDPSFGSGGKVLTDFGSPSDLALDAALAPNGKIVAAGSSFVGGDFEFALARYNRDGSPDASFGSGGTVLTHLGFFAEATGVTVEPNGKIVAAGTSDFDFAVARYNRDGSLDPSFGSGGTVITGFGPGSFDEAWGVAIEPGGKIVVAGESGGDFALVRYDRHGNLDPSFGSGGKVLTDFGGASSDAALAVAVEPNGKIVATGHTGTAPFTDFDFALVRYNRDGSVDPSFGSGGRVVTAFGVARFDEAWGVAIQPKGKIVVAGLTNAPADDEFAVARYDHDGSLDPSFGSDGKVMSGSIGQEAFDVALEPSGKAVVAGDGFGASEDFAVARLLAR
jgi:uncharacterized delta-60 repeat protein